MNKFRISLLLVLASPCLAFGNDPSAFLDAMETVETNVREMQAQVGSASESQELENVRAYLARLASRAQTAREAGRSWYDAVAGGRPSELQNLYRGSACNWALLIKTGYREIALENRLIPRNEPRIDGGVIAIGQDAIGRAGEAAGCQM